MLTVTPTYDLLVHVLVMALVAVLLDRKRPTLPLMCGLVFVILYGDYGVRAGLYITWIVGFIDGLLSVVAIGGFNA